MDEEEREHGPESAAPEGQRGSSDRVRRREKKSDGDERMELYDWIQCIVSALVVGILVFIFFVRVVNVEGSSMWPTLHDEDMILTSNFLYTPKAGDVVVFQTDSYSESPLVKRVIATEGQTVDIDFERGIVYVDGKAIDEPYTAELTVTREDFDGPVTVPEGCLFLMGDNRNHSTDSRRSTIGMVDERCVLGRVLMVVLPSNRGSLGENVKRDMSRIGSIY